MPDEKTPVEPSVPAPQTPPPPQEPQPGDATGKRYYQDTDEHRFQWYMERRKGYSAGARESYSRYDQTIAGVSVGSIVVSITFLKDIGQVPASIPWLLGSWLVFLVAGGASLISLRTSADCDLANLAALECLKDGASYKEFAKEAKKLGKRTEWLNHLSLVSFLIGIALMMVFAFLNISMLGGKNCPSTEKAVPAEKALARVPPAAVEPAPVRSVAPAEPGKAPQSRPAEEKRAAPPTSRRMGTPANPSSRAQ